MDRFNIVNETLGHSAGDDLLRAIGTRLRATLAQDDMIARLGGDEFVVILNDLADQSLAEQVAAKIVAALSEPIRIGKIHVPISVSVGVCTFFDDTVDAEVLLKRVDAAMYRAKQCGRSCFQVFTSDMLAPDLNSTPPA